MSTAAHSGTREYKRSAPVCRWHDECERKVWAAKDIPLLKVEAVGNGRRCRRK